MRIKRGHSRRSFSETAGAISVNTASIITQTRKYVSLVFFLCLSLQALAAAQFKIVTLQHRFAEDILPIVQPLVDSGGTISGMQNHLIIRTSAENMAEIEQIIHTLDVARQNFKITVSRQDYTNNSNSNTNITARKRIGNVEITTGDDPKNSQGGAHIQLNDRQTKTQNNIDQFINVTDGERAYISVGQSVPFTQEWVTLTRRYISVQRSTEFIDISTGFSVRSRSIGKQIEVEITPRIAQLNRNASIDFEELATTVRVNRGEWFDLGRTMQQKDEISRAILGWQKNSQSLNNQLFIRID